VGGNHGARASGSYTEEVTGAFTMTVGAMELIKVGSVTAAVLQVVADEAIDAATGMAASAAQRAEAALLGPIAPALSGARAALGGMAARTGPAAPMLGPAGPMSHPAMAAAAPGLAASPASLSAVPAIAAQTRAALGGALAELGVPNTAAQEAAAAAAAAGGGGGGGGPSGPTGGGTGTWSTTVGGAVSESIGGVCVINGGRGVSFAIGGSNTERVGGARVEKILGGKSETTGSSKQETVGIYMLKAAESLAITAKAAAVLNIAGSQRQKIGGSHSITAEGPLVINAPKLSVKASGTITLACGACKVIIKSGGVYVEGASSLTIEGSTVLLDENVLGT
jgi:hypothetical protein